MYNDLDHSAMLCSIFVPALKIYFSYVNNFQYHD